MTHHEENQDYFDKHDWKYWDSVLPIDKKSHGKYAHLIVSRNGDVIGVKPGYNEDGSKISKVGKRDNNITKEAAVSNAIDGSDSKTEIVV